MRCIRTVVGLVLMVIGGNEVSGEVKRWVSAKTRICSKDKRYRLTLIRAVVKRSCDDVKGRNRLVMGGMTFEGN